MITLLLLLSCAPRTEAPVPLSAPPEAFSEAGSAPRTDRWWTTLDDPALHALIDEALQGSFTLRAAWARLEAARAVVVRERADLAPEIEAYVSASRGTDDPLEGLQRLPVSYGVRASYEVDLWGRIRAAVEAERQRLYATEADMEAAAIGLTAEVAQAWFALQAARDQLELLEEQEADNARMARLMASRFRYGQVRHPDVLRQERLLEQTRAARLDQASRYEVLEHRLAVLLGRAPQQGIDPAPSGLPPLPPLPEAGIPVELLQRRPDVRAAEHALRAADAEVAAAVANQFPRLDLRASIDGTPVDPQDLLQGWVAQVTAGLVAPVFAAGRRRAEVRRSRAVERQRLAEYGTAVLTALQDVEDALARDAWQARRLESLTAQVDLATASADRLQEQYASGMVGYIDVLTARTTEQQLRRDLIEARRAHLSIRVDLYRALAGGFDVAPPPEEQG